MESDLESRRFQVPAEIVDELRAAGYIRSATDLLVKGGTDVGELALVVYNTGAATITLFQAPGVIRALAQSLVKWYRHKEPTYPFELTARGPHGHVDVKSDEAPDVEALTEFLRTNVWGEAAPPDRSDAE
jgi:hypothetical protein